MRRIFFNAGLSVATFFILLLIAEVVLQVAVRNFKPRFTKVHPVLGWYHTPGVSGSEEMEGHSYTLSYNEHGFRVPEHSFSNTSNKKRVVVLGDSFIDGSEVGDEETMTAQLVELLDDTEVINLGVYDFSTAQQYLAYQEYGKKFSPDLVVLVTTSNDFLDNLSNISYFGRRPRFVARKRQFRISRTRSSAKLYLVQESKLADTRGGLAAQE